MLHLIYIHTTRDPRIRECKKLSPTFFLFPLAFSCTGTLAVESSLRADMCTCAHVYVYTRSRTRKTLGRGCARTHTESKRRGAARLSLILVQKRHGRDTLVHCADERRECLLRCGLCTFDVTEEREREQRREKSRSQT